MGSLLFTTGEKSGLAACEARFPPRLAFGEQLSDGVVAVRSVFSAFFLVVDDRLQERAEHPLAKLVVLGCREHVDCHGARLPRGSPPVVAM